MANLKLLFYNGLYQRIPNCGAHPPPGGCTLSPGGVQEVYMRAIFILNEIWTKDKIYILVGTLLG
jgi:hypothetical protein